MMSESQMIPSFNNRYVLQHIDNYENVESQNTSICDMRPMMSDEEKNEVPICRICHCSEECSPESLITPCFCSGSLRYVHHFCLQQWIRSSNHKYCELCKFHFKLTIKSKPFLKWETLEMSSNERKKLICNLIFNLISMFCVFWSIYVLIERATIEARYGMLDWPFWTKMLVVTIGFLGGTIFLCVQLRLYFSILIRWRRFNRVIVIENAPPRDLIQIISNNTIDTQLKTIP